MKTLIIQRNFRPTGLNLAAMVAAASLVLLLAASARAQVTYAYTSLFTVAPGTGNIVTGANDRTLAFDALSNLVYVSSSGGSIGAYNATNGAYLGGFTTTGFSGGTYAVDQVGVAADGAIYAINLATASSSPNKIYRYSSWNSAYTTAFNGNALANGGALSYTSGRIGDTLAVTGSGTNTLLLAGVGGKPYFSLFYTTNGTSFTNTIIDITSGFTAPSGNIFGICFYTNNTFLVKSASSGNSTLYLIQYPTNFASQMVVTGTVVASTLLGAQYNNYTFLNYSTNGILATLTTASTNCAVALFNATNVASATLLLNTNVLVTSNPGNYTGGVALGGAGGTNVLYWIDSGSSFYAYGITNIPPVPPTLSSVPIGGTSYTPLTLGVTAGGTQPYHYFWQASTNDTSGATTFTNIPGANTNLYTVRAGTNYYQVIITNIAGAVTSAPVQVSILKSVTNSAVTTIWQVAPGTYSFLPGSGDGTRGIAYDTNTLRVVVVSSSGLNVLNATNGAFIEALSTTGVSFGGLLGGADQGVVADDGAFYAGNLVNGGGNFNLYRWSSPSNSVSATPAFTADPGNGNASNERWGDTLAARGAGPGTQILLGSRATGSAGTNVAFLTPNDGIGLTYSSQLIAVTNAPAGFASDGLSFGAGNTFWAKSFGGNLYEIGFETNTYTGWVIFSYTAGSQVPSPTAGLGVDVANGILGLVDLNDTPNDLQLSQLTGTSDSPVLFDQAFLATANANGNDNGAIAMKYPRAYALSVNNGVVAVNYGVPASTAPAITTAPASVTAYTNVGSLTLSVSATGSLPLYYQWQFNSNNIHGATSSVYVITNTALPVSGYYDVVVHNIAGSVTSAPPALVTLISPVSSLLVTQLWSIAAGTNGAYLTTSGYETRGLAYDPASTNLLIADHLNIHDYDSQTGVYLDDLNTAGLPTGGINSWTIDQIGVADDGILYAANLSPDGTAFAITSFGAYPYGSLNAAYGGTTGGNDLNTQDPAGDRWGDTMAIRGAGANTEILFGSYDSTNVALFTTPDGVNFTPQVIPVPGAPAGFAGSGIAFGPGNTFYAKGGHYYNLRWVSFDTNADVGAVLQTYVAGTQIPNNLAGLDVDVTNGILSGVCFDDSPNDLQLYLLSDNSNSPSLFEQDFFPSFNGNAQLNAVTTLKSGVGYALDVNNGVVAFTYGLPAAPAVTLTSVSYLPGNVTITWNNTFDYHDYEVYSTTNLLSTSWTLLSTITATNATASYVDSSPTSSQRFYKVVSQ